ncbi:MAG: hypothetical protein EP344_08030 [Bacteroidetes bacterium]|nr:MAG: hypothetical protein EP344_08030 [Bacteroidota bacterium]
MTFPVAGNFFCPIHPTNQPSNQPSNHPTNHPTIQPSNHPTIYFQYLKTIEMKRTLVLTLGGMLFFLGTAFSQNIDTQRPDPVRDEQVKEMPGNIPLPCATDPCPCQGGYIQIQVYYFGPDNVTVRAFGNPGLTQLITTFNNVMSGQLLTINGGGLPGGKLGTYTYLQLDEGGDLCTTRLFTRCPTEGWPFATEDLDILGKTYRNYTVYTVTDEGNNVQCSIENAAQDWHVGGNVVAATNNTLGTRNNESVVLITNDDARGIITNTGNFGINTATPTARLHVNGNTIVEQDLDVNGQARVNSNTASTNTTSGALVVTGGAGVSQNLNVGNNLNVGGDGVVNGILGVGTVPLTNLHVEGTGFRLSNGARRIDMSTNGTANGITTTGSNLFVRSPGTHIFFNTVGGDGKVAIGTTSVPDLLGAIDISTYKLYVQGGILTEELRVRTGWADYVFKDDYRLRSLGEVDRFIQQNGHLPDVPSEQEVQENGLSVGEAARFQQAKIEEIYLHLIEMDKQIKTLQAENKALQQRVRELEDR